MYKKRYLKQWHFYVKNQYCIHFQAGFFVFATFLSSALKISCSFFFSGEQNRADFPFIFSPFVLVRR